MSELKTWTVSRSGFAIVVTAETVELAVRNIIYETGITVANKELIPLPTHHRHVRFIPAPDGEDLTIYKRACESMAKQFIHPKMTGLEVAKMQLGET
jgi:hypothetical protein